MPAASARAEAEPHALPLPPVRLRTLLLLALVLGSIAWGYPRIEAAWKLHSSATALANYGLCMVGPTGPSLLRDNPAEFRSLVRRRVVAARADERPFDACAKLALEVTGSVEIERAHRVMAYSFAEYGALSPRAGRAEASVDDLRVSTRPVAELATAAWPFVRDGYTKLVKPSMSAKEAIHPVELPRANVGRGLPAWNAWYRPVLRQGKRHVVAFGSGANLSVFASEDGGLNWTSAPLSAARSFGERCGTGEGWFSFSLNAAGNTVMVTSHASDKALGTVPLARAEAEVFATSCDQNTLLAGLKARNKNDVAVRLCSHGGGCRPLELPRFPGVQARPRFPLDIARMDGVTVLVVPMNGIVRVASSRDDGRTWTPYSVAFDAGSHPSHRVDVAVPGRLLPLEGRLLLYGGAPKPSQSYSTLFSDDFGASWRTR